MDHHQAYHRGFAKGALTALCMLSVPGLVAYSADFQNLNFEAGPIYNSLDPAATYPDVLPNWTVRFGNTVQAGASCNNFILDYPVVALMSQAGFLGTNYVIAGDRSAYLQSSANLGNPSSAINVSISQIGMVPADAVSLVFDARNQWYDSFPIPPGLFNVTMDGVVVPLMTLTSNGGNVTYGANIANWSGQTTELSIGILANPAWGGANWEGWSVVDSIRFSVSPIPEPSSFALGALGALLLGFRRSRNSSR